MTEASCIFCNIVSGDIPADIVAESSNTLAFKDIAPLSKVHILVIPKKHYKDVVDLTESSPAVLGELMAQATNLAQQHTNGSFKLQFNTGAEAGQTVFHAHAHVLSDESKDDS
jgi:histidine triad (HIT) family protein